MKIKYPIGGFAPGHYAGTCIVCKEEFMGDKYAKQCEPCAINMLVESHASISIKLHKLKEALKQIKFSNDSINEITSETFL